MIHPYYYPYLLEWNGLISVTARMIDTKTGVVLSSAEVSAENTQAIHGKVEALASVLAGEKDQEDLATEILSMFRQAGVANAENWPVTIIRITRKNGREIAVINAGVLRNIRKGAQYLIVMPQYAVSEISGKKTIVGKKAVGSLRVDYVESDMGSGELKLDGEYRERPNDVIREGVALPFVGAIYYDAATQDIISAWRSSSLQI